MIKAALEDPPSNDEDSDGDCLVDLSTMQDCRAVWRHWYRPARRVALQDTCFCACMAVVPGGQLE